jgi:PEP-CTERM motif
MSAFRTLTAALLTMSTTQAVAWADTIQITGGVATGNTTSLDLVVSGESGLHVDAVFDPNDGIYAPAEQCFGPPCFPGRPFSVNAAWFGVGSGTASIDGNTFNLGQQDEQTGAINAFFEGILLLPSFTGEQFGSASAPFQFSGALFLPFELGFPPIDLPLAGRGTVTATFEWPHPDLPNSWIFRSISYEFESAAPVPEPTTLVLFGTGLGGLVVRRWRRISRTKS